jgi:hypothetical protein
MKIYQMPSLSLHFFKLGIGFVVFQLIVFFQSNVFAEESTHQTKGTVSTSEIVLVKFIPPKKEYLNDKNLISKWIYKIEKDEDGNAIFEYQIIAWISQNSSYEKDTILIKRKVSPQKNMIFDSDLIPEDGEHLALMEIHKENDNTFQMRDIWAIGKINQATIKSVYDNETANFNNVEKLTQAKTIDEKINIISEYLKQSDVKASMLLIIETKKISPLTSTQYQQVYKILAEYEKKTDTPTYVKDFIKYQLSHMPDPESKGKNDSSNVDANTKDALHRI